MDKMQESGKEQGGIMYARNQGSKVLKPVSIPVDKEGDIPRPIIVPTGPREAVLVKTPPRKVSLTKVSRETLLGIAEKKVEPEAPTNLSDREVLEHTASLWKYKPIPEDEPEPYKECITESATLGAFHVTAARVRGKKHRHEGTNCDDWFETRNIDSFVVSAVSDGAGSKKFSRIGAKTSCMGAMEYLEKELKGLILKKFELKSHLGQDLQDSRFQQAAAQMAQLAQQAVLAARQSVVNAWQQRQGDARYAKVVNRELQLNDFAATFLLTIALPIEGGDETFIVTCQVGDGMTAAISRNAPYEQIVTLLGNADSGAFSGETEFLTSSSVASLSSLMGRTRVTRKKVDVIMSMTDGVADDYDPNGREMLRLYLDMLVNRIISSPVLENLVLKMDKERRSEVEKNVPEPQSYPVVSKDSEPKNIPVQYTGELCKRQSVDLKKVWEEYMEYIAVMAESIHLNKDKSPATRLCDWLESYVVRGSFDDRTLVILQRGGH